MTSAAVAYLAILVVSALASYGLNWAWRWFALRRGILKQPGARDRDIHTKPIADASGIAMLGAFLVAMFIAWRLPFFGGVFRDSSEPLGVVIGASIIVFIQFIDDLRELSPPAKLAGVVLGASVMYFFGLSMFYFRIPFAGFVVLAADVAPLMTVLWVAGMTQAVNLMDGLDGLAAGVVAIAAASFTIYAQRLSDGGLLAPENLGPLLAVIACGICLGYLPHNIHPARLLMGDSGAYLLGVLMAASTLVVGGRIADQFSGQTYFFYAPDLHPAVHPGRADPRRRLVDHPAHVPADRLWHSRRRTHPPSPHAPRPRPASLRVHSVDVDRDSLGVRAVSHLRRGRPPTCEPHRAVRRSRTWPRALHALSPPSTGQKPDRPPHLPVAEQDPRRVA